MRTHLFLLFVTTTLSLYIPSPNSTATHNNVTKSQVQSLPTFLYSPRAPACDSQECESLKESIMAKILNMDSQAHSHQYEMWRDLDQYTWSQLGTMNDQLSKIRLIFTRSSNRDSDEIFASYLAFVRTMIKDADPQYASLPQLQTLLERVDDMPMDEAITTFNLIHGGLTYEARDETGPENKLSERAISVIRQWYPNVAPNDSKIYKREDDYLSPTPVQIDNLVRSSVAEAEKMNEQLHVPESTIELLSSNMDEMAQLSDSQYAKFVQMVESTNFTDPAQMDSLMNDLDDETLKQVESLTGLLAETMNDVAIVEKLPRDGGVWNWFSTGISSPGAVPLLTTTAFQVLWGIFKCKIIDCKKINTTYVVHEYPNGRPQPANGNWQNARPPPAQTQYARPQYTRPQYARPQYAQPPQAQRPPVQTIYATRPGPRSTGAVPEGLATPLNPSPAMETALEPSGLTIARRELNFEPTSASVDADAIKIPPTLNVSPLPPSKTLADLPSDFMLKRETGTGELQKFQGDFWRREVVAIGTGVGLIGGLLLLGAAYKLGQRLLRKGKLHVIVHKEERSLSAIDYSSANFCPVQGQVAMCCPPMGKKWWNKTNCRGSCHNMWTHYTACKQPTDTESILSVVKSCAAARLDAVCCPVQPNRNPPTDGWICDYLYKDGSTSLKPPTVEG